MKAADGVAHVGPWCRGRSLPVGPGLEAENSFDAVVAVCNDLE